MKLNKDNIISLILSFIIITFIVIIIKFTFLVSKEIKQNGLKGIVEEIWEGEKDSK